LPNVRGRRRRLVGESDARLLLARAEQSRAEEGVVDGATRGLDGTAESKGVKGLAGGRGK
jgi:hypothetical protein